MSIDKYQQSMENWKKEIILDPHLNSLFDSQMTPQQFHHKILALPHHDLINIYMKLTSLRQAITKHIHKDIDVHHHTIQTLFQQQQQSTHHYQLINQQTLQQQLKQIQKFNQKYEFISIRITQLKNINKILHFSKALQNLKVNTRLLKSLTKDIDQNNTKYSELINTLKISKIIKEIGLITIKFDFTGIKSFQEQRSFVNNIRGTIFGLVQRQLTSLLFHVDNLIRNRRGQVQKQVINKFVILNNLNKLKDFCIPLYKNSLNQMSLLLKKSLVIGQSVDQKDPKVYLQTFEEYFHSSIIRRLVQNGFTFIAIDEFLGKSTLKNPFNFNFFQKYWQNITSFMKDLIAWSIDNQNKEWSKQKIIQNLCDSYNILQTKRYISKYLLSIIWKYPIIYEGLTSMSNQIHLHLIKYATLYQYDYGLLKEQFLRVLLPLANLYYKAVYQFYINWKNKIQRIRQNKEEGRVQEYPIKIIGELFQNYEKKDSLHAHMNIMDWILSLLKTKQIYQIHLNQFISILDEYFITLKTIFDKYNPQQHNKDNFTVLISKYDSLLIKAKTILLRTKSTKQSKMDLFLNTLNPTKGILTTNPSKMIWLIQKFKGYQFQLSQYKVKIQ